MATIPQFASTPNVGTGVATTAYTATSGTLSIPTSPTGPIFTAGSNGSKVDAIELCGVGTGSTVANLVVIWVYQGSGTTYYPIRTYSIPAVSGSANVATFQQTLTFDNLIIPSGYSIYFGLGTADAQGIRATAFGGNY